MSSIGEALGRFRRAAVARVRNEPNIDWLVTRGLRLGEHTDIANPVYIDLLCPWLITIEDYVVIGPYSALITHDASFAEHTGQTRLGRVDIGKRVRVGVGAIVLPGTTIGEDSVIGAGAVVQGEVPPQSIVVGNPGKVSPIKAAVAWHRVSSARAPSWPIEGWTSGDIPEEHKREQREALAGCASGFVPGRAAPGSPYRLEQERRADAGTASGPESTEAGTPRAARSSS
jgi:acetyltransferase-like isoleucine patch superfamily enzyme